MKYQITEDSIFVLLENPDRVAPHRACLNPLLSMRETDAHVLLTATCKRLFSFKYRTQLSYLRAIRQFAVFLNEQDVHALPSTQLEWQELIVECYAWHLGRKQGGRLRTRQQLWRDSFQTWFRMMQEERIIPGVVRVPKARLRTELSRHGSVKSPKTIGELPPPSRLQHEHAHNKTLAGDLWASGDIEYLRAIEALLHQRVQTLTTVVDDHWLRLVRDYRTGRNLMRSVPHAEFMSCAQGGDWRSTFRLKGMIHPFLRTSPSVPSSEAWTLRIMHDVLQTSNSRDCLKADMLVKHPGLGAHFLAGVESTPVNELRKKTALRTNQVECFTLKMLYMRFLGVLSQIDIAVACVILIQEHPNLNPQALLSARLIDEHEKSILVETGVKGELQFSVEKPRANSRKHAHLTPRAARVMKHVVRATASVRALLKRTASPLWRHLFLGNAGRSIGHPVVASHQLSSTRVPSLARLYPELSEAGMQRGSLDFAKVRVTHGILEWFKTRSIRAVSRKLGNSDRVALEHYIPEELIHLWNDRILRRFQNVLIMLAVETKQRMLSQADFESENGLAEFLRRVKIEHPRDSSPIGPYVQRLKIDELEKGEETELFISNALLAVHLDPYSLGLLYACAEVFEPSASAATPLNNLIHCQEAAVLGRFLRTAVERNRVGPALSETIQLAKLKRVHELAIPIVPVLMALLKEPRKATKWSVNYED